MQASASTVWIIILVIFILMIAGFAVWVYTLSPPNVKLCSQKRKDDPAWNETCTFPQAIGKLDSTMKDPSTMQLFMADFSYSAVGGLPLCLPLWYRFRYVNEKSGNYSNFSKWSCSAVMAGGTNLPCPPECPEGNCSESISGSKSCTFNRVVMGTTSDLQYGPTDVNSDGSMNFAVVYRYVGKADDDVTKPPTDDPSIGEPLGMLSITSSYNGFIYAFTDIANNPCPYVSASIGCPQKCTICR